MKTAVATLNHKTDDWQYISNFVKIFNDNNHIGKIGIAIGGSGNYDKLSSVTFGYGKSSSATNRAFRSLR
jgi:hypothetical protein|tara:strand:- start:489 stop:698 length:210 start_codon:yes stop_codon:yes gene_type:complete